MRVRSRSSCRSRVSRACATSSSSVDSSERCSVRCTVATSLTDSAIIRVSSWKRVKRSNSSGSNACDAAFAASRRELICTSPCSSMSRSWPRRRSRFSVRSPSEPLIWPTPDSMRERVMLTSPAWLTSRSSSGARTRTADCVVSVRSAGLTAALPLPAKRDQSIVAGSLRASFAAAGASARAARPRARARSLLSFPLPASSGCVGFAGRQRRRRGRDERRRQLDRRRALRLGRSRHRCDRRDGRGDGVGIGLGIAAAQRLEGMRHRIRDRLQRLDVLGRWPGCRRRSGARSGSRGGAPSRPGASRRRGARRP